MLCLIETRIIGGGGEEKSSFWGESSIPGKKELCHF